MGYKNESLNFTLWRSISIQNTSPWSVFYPRTQSVWILEMGSESFPCVLHIFHFKERWKTMTQRSQSIRINLHNFVVVKQKNPTCSSFHSCVEAVSERPQKFEWFSVKMQLQVWCNKDQWRHQVGTCRRWEIRDFCDFSWGWKVTEKQK